MYKFYENCSPFDFYQSFFFLSILQKPSVDGILFYFLIPWAFIYFLNYS